MLLLLASFETFLYIGIYSILHMYILSTGKQELEMIKFYPLG